jgi:Protein of unknown function (DUF3014)
MVTILIIGSEAKMEQWSARDDSPYLREPQSAAILWWIFLLLVFSAAGGAAYYFWPQREILGPAPSTTSEPRRESPTAVQPQPQAALPFDADPAASAKPLPSLDNSDGLMRETVSGLVGRQAFDAMVYPSQLIRRIVATVDNLPRETASRRVMPLEPVPGRFGVAGTGEEVTLTATNSGRYAPYVRVLEALDSRTLARRYADSYPLFQRAYSELGFPGSRFHDRLLEAIDDLLAAPEPAGPLKLVQPKVFYQFADPELESLSAGQKIMLRMGAENAAKVKAKLREIRRELTTRQIR